VRGIFFPWGRDIPKGPELSRPLYRLKIGFSPGPGGVQLVLFSLRRSTAASFELLAPGWLERE